MTNSDVMDAYSFNNSKCMLRLLETTANTSDFVLFTNNTWWLSKYPDSV